MKKLLFLILLFPLTFAFVSAQPGHGPKKPKHHHNHGPNHHYSYQNTGYGQHNQVMHQQGNSMIVRKYHPNGHCYTIIEKARIWVPGHYVQTGCGHGNWVPGYWSWEVIRTEKVCAGNHHGGCHGW